MAIDTNVIFTDKDIGKNLYRKKTYYTLVIEQEVLANNKDEADQMFVENGGIDHSEIKSNLAEAKNGVETYMVDADYLESDKTEYIGKVDYEDEEHAKEDGLVEINDWANEISKTPYTQGEGI